jgi:hypothetical protein
MNKPRENKRWEWNHYQKGEIFSARLGVLKDSGDLRPENEKVRASV